MPGGLLKIPLHIGNACSSDNIRHGDIVEVKGELVLCNASNCETLTSRGIFEQLQNCATEISQLKLFKHFQHNYRPHIKAWFIQAIDRAAELISRNLELRMLQQEIEVEANEHKK